MLVAGIAVACLAFGSADGKSFGRCVKPHGYHVVTRSPRAVVFRNWHSYGCLRSRGVLVRLPYAHGNFKLAGRYVAYYLTASDETSQEYNFVVVHDLLTARRIHLGPAYTHPTDARDGSGENPAWITDMTLKHNGSVAWISCSPNVRETRCGGASADYPYEVWRMDRRRPHLLDASETIHPRSLKRTRSTLTWRDGDQTRTARLR